MATEKVASLNSKVWRLTLGRIVALIFLQTANFLWNGDQVPTSLAVMPRAATLIFAVWLGLSVIYVAAVSFNKKHLLAQTAIQLMLDALLISWLVWATGDVSSPYITLYTVVICLAGFFFTAQITLATAIACSILSTLLLMSVIFHVVPRYSAMSADVELYRAFQIVGFHDVAFLVVGLLAAQLAGRQRRSVAELKQTVQTLNNLQLLHERILQSIRSGLVTTDLDGRIYLFNTAAEEITGRKSDEVRGQTIYDLFGNIRRPVAESLAAIKKGEQPPRLEIEFVAQTNYARRLGYNVSPLFDEQGATTGYILTFQDLTDIRSMEESARRKDRLAAVGRVAAGLAHEIRNPLGAMRGAIQVLQPAMQKESAQAQLMDIVLRESDRLNAIITNFLQYARPHTSDFAVVDLSYIIKDALTLLRHSPDVRSVHEIIEDLPAAPVTVNADAASLKQVFWNLTRNAVQAMPDGGRLTIKLNVTPFNRAQIVFADTGLGMPPAQVERLFEPFSQSTTGGTGLGLSIVYQIIRDHHGTITVRSQENKGTTITVELPIESETRTK